MKITQKIIYFVYQINQILNNPYPVNNIYKTTDIFQFAPFSINSFFEKVVPISFISLVIYNFF